MPGSRLIAATLVVALVAVACGGDDIDVAEPLEQQPVVNGGESAAVDRDVASSDVAEAATPPAPVESVRLGARFGWCTDVQGAWDSAADSLSATIGVVASYYEALLAADNATDDLDRAEAAERAAALQQHLDDALDGYLAVLAAASREPRTAATDLLQVAQGVATGAGGGTQAVAYGRARGAYAAAAGEADMTLLEEFFGIQHYWKLETGERAEQLELPLPAAVHATLNIRELLDPHRIDRAAVFNALETAYGAVQRVVLADDTYEERIGHAAEWLTRYENYEHLLSEDIQPAIDAYAAEAGSYETVIADALDAALEAVSVLYAEAEAADLDVDERIAVQRTAAAAAEEIAWEHLTEAKERLQAASRAARAARKAAHDEASDETRDLIWAATVDADDAAYTAHQQARWGVGNAAEAVAEPLFAAQEAEAEAARNAAREALARDLSAAVVETAAAARGESLASAVIADLMLYQLETGMFDPGDMYVRPSFTPNGLGPFLTSAVPAETLIRSQAWRALQQSLADDCQ